MRLFIALNFDDLRDYFEALQNQIYEKEIKCTFPKSFHLTLKFLGELNDKLVDQVKEALTGVGFKPYKTTIASVGIFPSDNYIRTIWVSLEDKETTQLQQRIDNALQGIVKKEKNFVSHITLARVKHIDPDQKQRFVEKLHAIKTRKIETGVNKFYLIKSTLQPEGPVYEVIEEYPKQ